MTPQERDLIDSVFNRLAQVAGAPKDPEAERLIADRMRALPDAAYGLVQAVAVQESALRQAQAHIAELERRLAALPPAAPQGGSFLGGAPANPWAQSAPRAASPIPQVTPPQYAPQPQYGQPQYAPPQYAQPSPWGQPSAAGGFLRSAAQTAAGVAGGMLLAEGVSSLFGGHHGFGGGFGGLGGGGAMASGQPEIVENVTNNYYGDSAGGGDAGFTQADYSPADDGSGYDNSSDFGTDDTSGGDDGGWV